MSGQGKTLLHERFQWTPEIIDRVARLWNEENKSASEIAEALGHCVSRSAIIGMANRNRDKFMVKKPGDVVRPNKSRPRPAPKVAANTNTPVENDPSWMRRKHIPTDPAAPPTQQQLETMLKEWVSKNGEPRRFPQGFSGEWFNLRNKMLSLGWDLKKDGSWYTISRIGSGGRQKRLGRDDILRRIDEVLIANGLQPFLKRNYMEAAE